MARRQTAKALVEKFGDAARHSINVGARAERRAIRGFLNRSIVDAETRRDEAYAELQRLGWARKRADTASKTFAYVDALYAVKSWIGGRIQRTQRAGGIGRK